MLTRRRRIIAVLAVAVMVGPAARAAGDQVVARNRAVTVTETRLRALLAAMPNDARVKLQADPAALAELLRSTVLQDALLAQAHEKAWDRRPEVMAQIEQARQAIIVRSYVAGQLPPSAPPTETQIAAAYDANKARFMQPRQYHLAQIFVALPATATPAQIEQQRLKLAALRTRLSGKPADFAAAARLLSDDKRSAVVGGDLGWLREDNVAPPIRAAVSGLQEASISDPLRTPDGWHLIELIATRPAGPAPLDQVRATITQALAEQQRQVATRSYLDDVMKRDPIEINQVALGGLTQPAGAR